MACTYNRSRVRQHSKRVTLTVTLCTALALSLAGVAGSALTPSGAAAQESFGGLKDSSPQDRPQMISVFTGFLADSLLSYGFPMTIGGRYYYPIMPNGFIPALNDEFGIEGGLDMILLFGNNVYFGLGFPVNVLWDFHFSPSFDAYAKLGFTIGSTFDYDGFWWRPSPAVGMRLKLNDVLYFRAEAGFPSIMAGLGFAI